MKNLFLLLLLVLAMSCAGSLSKKQMAAFDNKVDQVKLSTVKDLGPSSSSRIPLKAGQWVTVHTQVKDSNKDQILSTFKVIKVQGKTVTMEVETTNASTLDLQIMQYEVENFPFYSKLNLTKPELAKLVDKMKIKKIIIKKGYEPAKELSSEYMPMAKSMLKELYSNGYRISEPKRVACSSNYLKSNRCSVYDFEATAFGATIRGTSYAHGAIPVVGFIKSESNKSKTQVLNFGLTGAKSSL